ncbi:MAG: thioredoxin [Planctomycetaceae bacterium]
MAESSPWITQTSAETFEQDVVMASNERVVVVDFWAPWCEPCRQLMPMLETLARESNGKFQLVKVNIDEQPEIAQAFRVQSIPHVAALSEGQLIDQFQGLLPEEQLREWISRLVPSRTDELLREGESLEATDPQAAESCYREAVELSPDDDRPKVALARVTLAQDRDEEAAKIIAELEQRGFLEPDAERIKSQLELRSAAEEAGGLSEIRKAVEESPDDLSLKIKLADALAVARKHEEALQICLAVIEADKHGVGQEAKETMVKIFDMLGPSSELTNIYRRKLATAWY